MADDDLSGLLNIGLDFNSDSEPDEAADPNTGSTTTNGNSRSDRNALSETDFQSLKQSYKPKLENGEVRLSYYINLHTFCSASRPEEKRPLTHPLIPKFTPFTQVY